MSADNWAVCPRCKVRHAAKGIEARQTADTSYGSVPIEEWKALDLAANALAVDFSKQTFREDYDIYGAEDGSVEVSYRGGCSECGLSISFEVSREIEGVNE